MGDLFNGNEKSDGMAPSRKWLAAARAGRRGGKLARPQAVG